MERRNSSSNSFDQKHNYHDESLMCFLKTACLIQMVLKHAITSIRNLLLAIGQRSSPVITELV